MQGGDYYNAMYYYTTALEFDSTRLDMQYNLGEASQYFNAYVPASRSISGMYWKMIEDNSYPQSFL